MVPSQLTGTKEKESFKDGANSSLNATETPLGIGMVITSCTAPAADQQVNINSSETAIISKNTSQLEDTFDATSTTEGINIPMKLAGNVRIIAWYQMSTKNHVLIFLTSKYRLRQRKEVTK